MTAGQSLTATPGVAPAKAVPTPKAVTPPLDTAQAKAILRNARPAVAYCLCGCEGLTKGRFVPGHDAKLKSRLAATVADGTPAAATAAADALVAFGWDTPAS